MKVIDLLNKMANGEYENNIIFECEDKVYNIVGLLESYSVNSYVLNAEIKIIEEDKKIESLYMCSNFMKDGEMTSNYAEERLEDITSHNFDVIHTKINEIIDVLNRLKENK